jgi:hypothetical protein
MLVLGASVFVKEANEGIHQKCLCVVGIGVEAVGALAIAEVGAPCFLAVPSCPVLGVGAACSLRLALVKLHSERMAGVQSMILVKIWSILFVHH